MRYWYRVHPRKKRLPPMVLTFNKFLCAEDTELSTRLESILAKAARGKRSCRQAQDGKPAVIARTQKTRILFRKLFFRLPF